MNDLDAMPFATPTDPNLGAPEPRKCRRHQWARVFEPTSGVDRWVCARCRVVKDEARSRRGRTSLRAGKDAERQIAKAYGGKRTGQFGGPDDVQVGELFVVQSKAGGWFSERVWAELQKLPRTGGRVPLLVVSDRPGSGHATRRYVVLEMRDHVAVSGLDGVKP
jgi:hypothetical protein